MHLLPVAQGVIDDGEQAVDLGQSAADIVFLSAADSELAMLSEAWRRIAVRSSELPRLRLASYLALKHNYSVDLYVEQTVSTAKVVVLRLLGGKSYWAYGVERIEQLARERGQQLVLLPGCPKPDPQLLAGSSIPFDRAEQLWRCLVEGGPQNAERVLEDLVALASNTPAKATAETLPAAGIYADRPSPLQRGEALVLFYRASLQAGDLAAVDALIDALSARGLTTRAVYVTSLRDPAAAATITNAIADRPPDVVLNFTAFASGITPADPRLSPIGCDAPWLQVIGSAQSIETWAENAAGLVARDVAMHVALPEIDGRIVTRAIAFKKDTGRDPLTELIVVRMTALPDRVAYVADLASRWVSLRRGSRQDRKIAVVLANYPNGEHRIAHAVGLDTPASACEILRNLKAAGYQVTDTPTGDELVARLLEGPTAAAAADRQVRVAMPLDLYRRHWSAVPSLVRAAVERRWGHPEADHYCLGEVFSLPILPLGNVFVAIQPSRGYGVDPKATYHDQALVPPHGYFAFYFWLREVARIDAVVHLGKHGNLEWLPGKALALSSECYPEIALGPVPNLYPFIVNDPGEGSQAKRRTAAVVLDHLPPPQCEAGTHGALALLEGSVDEYYEAQRLDRRRAARISAEILDNARRLGLDADLGIDRDEPQEQQLAKLDAYLCDLKEMQIRGGLHIFGQPPSASARLEMLQAIARAPRGHEPGDRDLPGAIAADLGIDISTSASPADPWQGARPACLSEVSAAPWRTVSDTRERLNLRARLLLEHPATCPPEWQRTRAVLQTIDAHIAPALDRSAPTEMANLLRGLDGRFVPAGPSGAPTRGRPDVLPTGRNFYTLDTRTVPTPTAWEIGRAAAEIVVERYFQDHGTWPKAIALSAWGTANMRTGGDDIAQAMAFIGVKPVWEPSTRRVTGFEITPLAKLGRPRIDVTLKISGFFRDAFPGQIDLLDSAIRAVASLDELPGENPIAERVTAEAAAAKAMGRSPAEALRRATYRIFGARPGSYGAGLGTPVEAGLWDTPEDLTGVFLDWGQYAYGSDTDGVADRGAIENRLSEIDLVVQAQDNREHDMLDSDDYWQFAGGLALTAKTLQSREIEVYHADTSRTDRLAVRPLTEEISRIVHGRATNPRWIEGMMRHGWRGAMEMAQTVDFLFAFAATTSAVGHHHFDALFTAYLADDRVRAFLETSNPGALVAMARRFEEAAERGLWSPRRNSVGAILTQLKEAAE